MSEHLCCAIADKKHQTGVNDKRNWLAERIKEGHIFRKLDAQGKVFIEYAPLEKAWILVTGDNYFYIYCLWVSGSYKGKGYGKELLQSCIDDALSDCLSHHQYRFFLFGRRRLLHECTSDDGMLSIYGGQGK